MLNEVLLQKSLREKPRRYYLKDKRKRTIKTIYREICFKCNYYYDVQTKKYVCLLDKSIGLQKRFKYDQQYEKTILRLMKIGIRNLRILANSQSIKASKSTIHRMIKRFKMQPLPKPTFNKNLNLYFGIWHRLQHLVILELIDLQLSIGLNQ